MRLSTLPPLPAFLSLLLILGSVSCREAGQSPLRILETPVPVDSRTPNLAAGHGRLYMSWIEERERAAVLRFSSYDTSAWESPAEVPVDGDLFVNWADFASLRPLGERHLAVHYLQRMAGSAFAYQAWLRVSPDGGKTWGPALRLHDDETRAEHGFVSLAERDPGRMGIVWLDGREMSGPEGRTRLMYREWSPDGLGPERTLDPDVCTCCQTGAASTDSGLVVAYRDHADGEIRDISTVRLEDEAWSAPGGLHDDGWEIAGCPVNGPAIDSTGSNVVLSWFTAAGGEPRVLVSRAVGSGGFEPPRRIDEGDPLGRVGVVALEDGGLVVSWLESRRVASVSGDGSLHRNAEIRLRRLGPDLEPLDSRVVGLTSAGRSSGFPRIARLEDTLYIAWTEPSGASSRVRVAAVGL